MSRRARTFVTFSWAAVAVIVPATAARGGFYSPPPPDVHPVWSPDGTAIVYERRGPSHLRVVRPDGSGDRALAGVPYGAFSFSRDWHWLAVVPFVAPGPTQLLVMRPSSEDRRSVAQDAVPSSEPSFSPDGASVAYSAWGGTVRVVRIDGSEPRSIGRGAEPVWSPDGRRISFFDGRVGKNSPPVVYDSADGSLTQVYLGDEDRDEFVAWSPDGGRLAFVAQTPQGRMFAVREFVPRRLTAFPVPKWVARFVWTPDGKAVIFAGPDALRLDVATGATTDVGHAGWDLTLAPDGDRIAYSEPGECGDRVGIYVRPLNGVAQRITNDCRVRGTQGPDTLRSSNELYEILLGLGGDDTLVARGAPYVGDALDGGDGNDRLVGGYWPEKLDGGRGNDVLLGGVNYDTLIGGPGRDRIYGQGGRDTIFARDGSRDVIDCGTNTGKTNTSPELDRAYVDRIDVVAHCEKVFRSRR